MNHDSNLNPSDGSASTCEEDDATGLPALSTWRAVYLFVTLVFIAYVVLLGALNRVFA